MFVFLDPVPIANIGFETFREEYSFLTDQTGPNFTSTAAGGGGTTFSLVGSSATFFDQGVSSVTHIADGFTFFGQTIYADTRPASSTVITLTFPTSTAMGTIAETTVPLTSSEVTTSASTTTTRWSSQTVTARRFSSGSSYETTRAVATTTNVTTSYQTFTTVTTDAVTTALTSDTLSMELTGPGPFSYKARVYAQPGEVLYVRTEGAPGVAWQGGPGWITATSAEFEGAGVAHSEISSPGSNSDTYSTLIPDITYSLTWHSIATIGERTLAVPTFNETFSGLTTITTAQTQLSTTGAGGVADHTTLFAGSPIEFGFRNVTTTDFTTVTDYVTDTEGEPGNPRTLVTTATTTRLSAEPLEMQTVENYVSSGGATTVETFRQFRTYLDFTVEHLTNWAGGAAANPYGPAARLRRVPFNGWQKLGAHGVEESVYENVVHGGQNPEFAMLGGVQLATESRASVESVNTVERTIEAKTWRDDGHAVLLGQKAMRGTVGETVFYPHGAAFVANHSDTTMSLTTFEARSSREFFTNPAEKVYETFAWLELEYVTRRSPSPFDTPADLDARVYAGPLCNSSPL